MSMPDIIFLNGSTSSGKSSIARGLQARLPEPFLHYGIDHVLRRCPPQWMETPEGFQLVALPNGEMPLRLGEGAHRVLRAWHAMVRAGVDAGLRFIIDDVLLVDSLLPDWVEALDGRDVFFVGVRCDLEELQRREIARGDRGVGQALSQYAAVHRHEHYDLVVDTTATPTEACVEAIVAGLDSRRRPSVFERLRGTGA